MKALTITIFSDFSCPYSYVTESALRRVADARVRVVYRAYELYPGPDALAPPIDAGPAWNEIRRLGATEGVDLREPPARPRTRKAHEVSRFAREHGVEEEVRARIFDAYWGHGRDIGRIDVLTEVAEGAGLNAEDLKIALDIDRYEDAIIAEGALARRLNVPGTPTLFLGSGQEARVVGGARGADELRKLIEAAAG